MASDKALKEFAQRMNEICDDMEIPPKGKGRQTTLAARFHVSQGATLKWLEGDAYPTIDHAKIIARWAGVNFEWLMTGHGDKHPVKRYGDKTIEHIVAVLQTMEPEQRYLAESLIDTLANSTKGK